MPFANIERQSVFTQNAGSELVKLLTQSMKKTRRSWKVNLRLRCFPPRVALTAPGRCVRRAGTPEYVHAMVNTFQQYNVAVNDIMATTFAEKDGQKLLHFFRT